MRTVPHFTRLFLTALVIGAMPARSQTAVNLEAITQRLERLEQQNTELLTEVRLLRQELTKAKQETPAGALERPAESASTAARLEELEEKLEVQAGRVAEQDQVKVETTHRVPVRLTGMALFNLFSNTQHGGGADNPVVASAASAPANSGATLRQSVLGLEFEGPEAVLGGRFRGSFIMDAFGGDSEVLYQTVRLRTAFIEGQWNSRSFLVGQEKPIFAPREPNSLAQVGVSPLTAAGNLWRWRPQARFEQRLTLGPGQELSARIGVSQTYEEGARITPELYSTLASKRPALEGRFQFAHKFDDRRRIEIAPGFHVSQTHVAGASVPARAFSLDWFLNPIERIEFTGAWFFGRNLAKLGGGGGGQGFTIVTVAPGQFRVIPVRTRGGWAQVTFVATPRLSFNLYGGEDDPNNFDLAPGGIARNMAYAANIFYRLANNVVIGGEASQVRTWFLNGQRPLNNHYDLALAYLF
ncbi:MAG: hypothetical protein HY236_14050 [Acidobacteria bacterium]|nr:hypothetical protein [Acidobacteriota bacterium]